MRKQYDPAYKLEVCQAVASGTASVAGMSRETGIPENTIRMWMRRYREHKDQSFVGSGHILPENEEFIRLKREVRDLREENEILKKAAAYFAKHQK
jgi:transposase